jgi:hypothetical protein
MEDQLSYQAILDKLAPCGIDCERCVAFARGRVKNLATELTTALEGFENMAPRVVDRVPALAEYERFVEILDFFAQATCAGCREGGSELPFCAARTCFREQGVDYCFQCTEYPCDRNTYPENLTRRWRSANDGMREVGVELYYRQSLERPRY